MVELEALAGANETTAASGMKKESRPKKKIERIYERENAKGECMQKNLFMVDSSSPRRGKGDERNQKRSNAQRSNRSQGSKVRRKRALA